SEHVLTSTTSYPIRPTANAYQAPQPYFQTPSQLTTSLTLYVTGESGDVKPLVTTVIVPFYAQQPQQQPISFSSVPHIRIARSVRPEYSGETILRNARREEIYSGEATE